MSSVDKITLCGPTSGGKCGYCHKNSIDKSTFGFICQDMHAETYLNLMKRGFRRCGTYYYKPYNNKTCCPMYTIRCNTTNFDISKSQRKILKKLRSFLMNGNKDIKKSVVNKLKVSARGDEPLSDVKCTNESTELKCKKEDKSRKSKHIRYQHHIDKLKERAAKENVNYDTLFDEYQLRVAKRREMNRPKTLSELLSFEGLRNPKHKLEVKTVRSRPISRELQAHLKKEHRVYQKYQIAVHKDSPSQVDMEQFKRFLVSGGLRSPASSPNVVDAIGSSTTGPLPEGQYHQQYWLDDKLIAVGVIDCLPDGISAVYLFYDPDFEFLNLGVYSALQEIRFVQELCQKRSDNKFCNYYMGYYIHNCPKMRYKAQYRGSELACPESFNFESIVTCQTLLDRSNYARFSAPNCPDPDSLATKNSTEIADLITVELKGISYKLSMFATMIPDMTVFIEFAQLVGSKALAKLKINLS